MKRQLPCYPCPHESACCNYGVDLSVKEALAIAAHHSIVTLTVGEQGMRTRVVDGACVFLSGNKCSIHDKPYYPAVCKGFPWTNAEGGPYEGDCSICPEIRTSEGTYSQDEKGST